MLIDVGLVELFRQLSAAQVRNLLITSLNRHSRGNTGQVARSNMSLRDEDGTTSTTTFYWSLESQNGRPGRRVSELVAEDSARLSCERIGDGS